MITAAQMRAGRALLGIDQQTLADLAGVSLPTIQRMEASEGNVRGVVETLTKVVTAFDLRGRRVDRGGHAQRRSGTRRTLQGQPCRQDQRALIGSDAQEGPHRAVRVIPDDTIDTATATAD